MGQMGLFLRISCIKCMHEYLLCLGFHIFCLISTVFAVKLASAHQQNKVHIICFILWTMKDEL